jgi:hypothetical protein
MNKPIYETSSGKERRLRLRKKMLPAAKESPSEAQKHVFGESFVCRGLRSISLRQRLDPMGSHLSAMAKA